MDIIMDQYRATLEEIKELGASRGSVEYPEARGRRAKRSLSRLQNLLEIV